MRTTPFNRNRLLIVAALALPVLASIGGCKSADTASPAAPQTATNGAEANDDAALAARVKAALVADPELKALPMSVATYRGAVQLSGYVDSDVQMQRALAVARGVPGVQSIGNDLHVRGR